MNRDTLKYTRVLVDQLKEQALKAQSNIKNPQKTQKSNLDFDKGCLMAFHTILSLMKHQIKAFNISEKKVGLNTINPDRDLLNLN